MPVAVKNSCMEHEGWKSPLGRKVASERPGATNAEICEAIASMVENTRKKKDSARGGDGDPITGTACFVQVAKGGDFSATGDSVWVLAMENDARIKDINGATHLVAMEAHAAALEDWTQAGVLHEVDHRRDKTLDVDIKEAKLEWNGDLYLKVAAKDPEIHKAIQTGAFRPSVEVRFWPEDADKDGIHCYVPRAVGWMFEGTPRSPNAGPAEPGVNVLEAKGGTDVADNTNTNEPKKDAPKDDPKKQAEPDKKPADQPANPDQTELIKLRAVLAEKEKLLAEHEKKMEVGSKTNKAVESEYRSLLASRLPERIRATVSDDTPIDEVKRMITIYEVARDETMTQIKELEKRVGEAPPRLNQALGKGKTGSDISDEEYERLKSQDPTFKKSKFRIASGNRK